MVYVISQNGQPLMPTENHAKVRKLLKDKKAKVNKLIMFGIKRGIATEIAEVKG